MIARAEETTSDNAVQAAESTSGEPQTKPAGTAPSLLDLLSNGVIYLPNSNADLVPVPLNATLEMWLEFLKQPRVKPAPPPAVASVTLSGTADDERAVLTAQFVIQNESGNEFVPISLGMNEAVLRKDWTHEGPGEFVFKSNDRVQGYTWWLRGSGRHQVTLEISVPVKKQVANRRLQLSLPDAAQSRLTLATPFPSVSAKSAAGDVQVVSPAGQPARMELLGLGPRFDLTWQPIIEKATAAPLLEAETTILAYASSGELLVEAYQRVHVVQGSITQIVERLPTRAKEVFVEGRDYRSHEVSADDPALVTVQLTSPNTSQVQLKWTLRLPAEERGNFILNGFQVESARKQSGQIGLIPVEDLRLSISQADHPHLLRTDAAELRTLSAQVSRAYRFFSQPLRVAVGLETVEPYFTSAPRLALNVSLSQLNLEGEFAVKVLRGKLRFLDLEWPNWKADGWILDALEPQGELIEGIEPEIQDKPGRLRVRLVDDHDEQFVLRLKAHRPNQTGEAVPVSMPQLRAPDSVPPLLAIVEADNLACELTRIGETVLELQSADTVMKPTDAAPSSARKTRNYRALSDEQLFSLRTIRQERRVQIVSVTQLELIGNRLRGVQSLQLDVEHERLSQLLLAVPDAWRTTVTRFQIDPDRAVAADWSAGEAEGMAIAQLTLPESRIGPFTIQALFELPVPESVLAGETSLEIPVVSCVDHAIRQFSLQIPAGADSDLIVADAKWKPRSDSAGVARWVAEGPISSVRVQWENGGGASQQLLIHSADIRAEWDRQGTVRAVAKYRVSGSYSRINFVLPDEANLVQATWDDRPLMEPGDIVTDNRPRHYTLKVRSSSAESTEHRLTIESVCPATQACGLWNSWTLPIPKLPQGRWLGQGTWQVRFPSNQHLFSYDASVTPRFHWQRNGIVWSRVSPVDIADRKAEEAVAMPWRQGNSYAFSQFGELRDFRFSTMSGPMILLVGASVSLLVGFLVLNIPKLQNLMTLWGGLFALAVAGLWFGPQLEVLLQPILLGLLFPLAAIWIQSFRRRDIPPVLSFDPLMDLVETRSSVTRSRFPGEAAGPEPVLARSPSGSTHDFLRSEAGSGV